MVKVFEWYNCIVYRFISKLTLLLNIDNSFEKLRKQRLKVTVNVGHNFNHNNKNNINNNVCNINNNKMK